MIEITLVNAIIPSNMINTRTVVTTITITAVGTNATIAMIATSCLLILVLSSAPLFGLQDFLPPLQKPGLASAHVYMYVCIKIYIYIYMIYGAFIDGSIIQPWHLRYTETHFLVSRYVGDKHPKIQNSKNPKI